MVWNVHGFRAGVGAVAEGIDRVQPDVLVLNETRYRGFGLRRFAHRVGMFVASGTGWWRAIPNAVLCRPPWRVVRTDTLAFPRRGRTVRRGVVLATVGRTGTRLDVAAVHLGLSGPERVDHARVLTDTVAGRGPLLIGGDLNEGPDGPAASWIGKRYWDACAGRCGPTFPSTAPRVRIDYLFVSEGIEVSSASVPADLRPLSDHLPVVAELTVG
jgi:endonuclease/exonuclease/phosphatase family metal-dependent hydrolase